MRSDEGLVLVAFKVRPAPRRGIRGESLWAEPVADRRVRLRNIPFHVGGVSAEDVVFTRRQRGVLVFDGVSLRGGHSTYWLDLEREEERPGFEARRKGLLDLGCTFEGGGGGAYAMDVPPHADADEVVALLEEGVSAGVWCYEEANREHPRRDG